MITEYDEKSDALYVRLSSKKVYSTVELSSNVAVDVNANGNPAGVELLSASKVISDLFNKRISRKKVGELLCSIREKDLVYLDFELDGEHASLAIQKAYKSPVLSS